MGKEWNKVQAVQSDSSIITSESGVSSHTTDCWNPSGDMKEKERKKERWTEPTAIWCLFWLSDDDKWWLVSLSLTLPDGRKEPYRGRIQKPTRLCGLWNALPCKWLHALFSLRVKLHIKCPERRRNTKTFWGWVKNNFQSHKPNRGFIDLERSVLYERKIRQMRKIYNLCHVSTRPDPCKHKCSMLASLTREFILVGGES